MNSEAAKRWDAVSSQPRHWWQFPPVWRHINGLYGLPGNTRRQEGFNHIIRETTGQALRRGVSVGCGDGTKEMRLILEGIVDRLVRDRTDQ